MAYRHAKLTFTTFQIECPHCDCLVPEPETFNTEWNYYKGVMAHDEIQTCNNCGNYFQLTERAFKRGV